MTDRPWTPERIKDELALHAATTDDVWHVYDQYEHVPQEKGDSPFDGMEPTNRADVAVYDDDGPAPIARDCSRADAEFIIAAHENYPSALKALEAALERCSSLEAALKDPSAVRRIDPC